MAKQIITLGIGAMDNLTPFITTGLEVGAPVASAADRAIFKGMWRGMFRKMNLTTFLVILCLMSGN